jgi:predicted Zn-dependent peptidase
MKLNLIQIIVSVTAILFPMSMSAQEVPLMKADKSVISGVLPDGMSYYLVSNPSDKGSADFALVQKTGRLNVADSTVSLPEKVVDVSRDALAALPRFGALVPQKFLTMHGAAAGPEGYVDVRDDATVFRFRDVRISDGKSVLDSVLLAVMDIADRANTSGDEFVGRWYGPESQAVVVSGDIDAQEVALKLRMMSYMIPAKEECERQELKDMESGQLAFLCDPCQDSRLGTVSLEWSSKRVPREYMPTVQPVIFDMSLDVLGRIASRRVKMNLEKAGIPFADVSYGRTGSDRTPYDDRFSVSVTSEKKHAADILAILTEVMASLDVAGALPGEYLLAETGFLADMKEQARRVICTNEEYVDRCISAFLYNSSLASPKEVYAFHRSRNVDESFKRNLFNTIVSALLQPSANLEVRSPLDTVESRRIFDSVWAEVASGSDARPWIDRRADSTAFPGPGIKVKLKSAKEDPLSGGIVWTFSNGFKVIYRKMASAGEMYYALALNGGYGSIPGLEKGEGAFVSDVLRLSRVSGMKYDVFQELLIKEGVQLEARVTLSNTVVEGQLPKEKMSLLMRALLALANEREGLSQAYPYYKAGEELALEYGKEGFDARMTAIDSIMCPDYKFSSYKSEGGLTDGLFVKADDFFVNQMSKLNDGVLVLVGDMDEDGLKKLLLGFVGGFRTKEVALRRPVLRYQPVSGWTTYTLPGPAGSVDVAMSSRMPLTAENHLASSLAVMVLQRELTAALEGSSMRLDVSSSCRIYPEERLNLLVTLYEAPEDGFASGMEMMKPIEALDLVRRTLSDMSGIDVSDDVLKVCKANLKNRISYELKDPAYWVDAIVMRYLDGKDFTTGYAAKVDGITKGKVKEILGLLDKGCKIEYVITK